MLYTDEYTGQTFDLSEYPAGPGDPGGELKEDEYWHFWAFPGHKGRIRMKNGKSVVNLGWSDFQNRG